MNFKSFVTNKEHSVLFQYATEKFDFTLLDIILEL